MNYDRDLYVALYCERYDLAALAREAHKPLPAAPAAHIAAAILDGMPAEIAGAARLAALWDAEQAPMPIPVSLRKVTRRYAPETPDVLRGLIRGAA